MIVVSDSSPIIALSTIGHLDSLKALFGQIVIPTEVFREVGHAGNARPGAREIAQSWIEVAIVREVGQVAALASRLDFGEAATVSLALELQATTVLLDEKRGRVEATRLGLKPVGVLGILQLAKTEGLVPALRPLLTDLRDHSGFRIHPDLLHRVLIEAGED